MADVMSKIFALILGVIGLQIIAETVATAILNLTGIAATVAGFITVFFALALLKLALSSSK